MTDDRNDRNDRFDELLDDALRAYHRPPNERHIPFDEMWQAIETQAFPAAHRPNHRAHYLAIAAALVIGIGIGRFSNLIGRVRPAAVAPNTSLSVGTNSQSTTHNPQPTTQPLDLETSRYLGQAAALLIALPAETNGARPDQPFIKRANDLLLTTRLLLDSPSASDPSLRNLLEDLELVLVQVVRLEKERESARRTEMELIQQALDQRDVIPRLRSAASEYAADD
jgi:hypothetical protein